MNAPVAVVILVTFHGCICLSHGSGWLQPWAALRQGVIITQCKDSGFSYLHCRDSSKSSWAIFNQVPPRTKSTFLIFLAALCWSLPASWCSSAISRWWTTHLYQKAAFLFGSQIHCLAFCTSEFSLFLLTSALQIMCFCSYFFPLPYWHCLSILSLADFVRHFLWPSN